MAPENPRVSILIAEDSRIQAKMLHSKLVEAGYDVRVAENGRIALEMIREQRPTLVISDIEMPEMTGYELCEAVKSDAELKTIPFILLSTLSDPEDIIRGLHCGADNYVTKPYDPVFLLSRVRSLLDTPVLDEEDMQQLDVTLAGTRYTVKSGRQQVLNLLVSTFENAVEKNKELLQANEDLTAARDQLSVWNEQLENLNTQLESANERMSKDLKAAAKVQQSLLPSSLPPTDRVKFAWRYLPCDELAGDFLNFFQLDDEHIAAFVVDVSGHGVASSLLSVTIGRVMTPQISASSLLVREDSSLHITPPLEVAGDLNQRFPMADQNNLYFTMVYGILNTRTLELKYVLAGHPRIVRVPVRGEPHMLEGDGMAIGWLDDLIWDEYTTQLEPGDRVYLYSDGVPEVMNDNHDQFGNRQILEMVELGRTQPLDASVDLLVKGVERWCNQKPQDDVSILGFEIQ